MCLLVLDVLGLITLSVPFPPVLHATPQSVTPLVLSSYSSLPFVGSFPHFIPCFRVSPNADLFLLFVAYFRLCLYTAGSPVIL